MLSLKAYAKINLYLDVLSKYQNGYHQIESVMQSVSLFDLVEISPAKDISITCNIKELENENNLAYKVAKHFFEKQKINAGVRIKIEKNIPMAAGLAGGSADAAATLIGLNILFKQHLSLDRIQKIGETLGADIPFCCVGGTKLAEGKGEILKDLPDLPQANILLATPPISVSTAEIYKELDLSNLRPLNRRQDILNAITSQDINNITSSLGNLLEEVAMKKYPLISKVKALIKEAGCNGVLMSGSGPTVFAICENSNQAKSISQDLKNFDKNIFTKIVKPVARGVNFV